MARSGDVQQLWITQELLSKLYRAAFYGNKSNTCMRFPYEAEKHEFFFGVSYKDYINWNKDDQ